MERAYPFLKMENYCHQNKNKIMPVLEKYLSNPELDGTVSDTFDDFEVFLEGKQLTLVLIVKK